MQHLSTYVQGGHADFKDPGNQTSIGIEMCEYLGVDLNTVIDRTARLTAYLMWKHHIPLGHVVLHYQWPRACMKPVQKAYAHFLMDNGRPGVKWAGFKRCVYAHCRRLSGY
jgi:N-acetylmuramoyl-L-alanine amidase